MTVQMLKALVFGGVLAISACARTPKASSSVAGRPPSLDCPPLALRFVIDKEYDAQTIFGMLHGINPGGASARAADMGVGDDLARRIHVASDYASVAEEIARIVETRHSENSARLEGARSEYERLWAPVLGRFAKVVTSETGHCWFHSTPEIQYTDVVSAFHRGVSSWYGNTIATGFNLSPESKLRISAHEIVLSQVFHVIRKYHPQSEISDWHVWALSELTAVWILSDPRLRPYWPTFRTSEYFAHSNYPQLAELEQELAPIYGRRASFRAYADEAVARVRGLEQQALTTRKP